MYVDVAILSQCNYCSKTPTKISPSIRDWLNKNMTTSKIHCNSKETPGIISLGSNFVGIKHCYIFTYFINPGEDTLRCE